MAEHKWYIVHTQSGKEETAKKALDNRLKHENHFAALISDSVVPKYKETVYKDGKRRTVNKKSFPGYLYVKMQIGREAMQFVNDTPYVSQFVMGDQDAGPRPLTEKELKGILTKEDSLQADMNTMQIDFDVGQKVLIIDGPFNNFNGTIKAIYPDKGKVCVNVEIFGRITPVEIDYFKVKKN